MIHDGKDITVTIGGKAFPVRSIEYSDKAEVPQPDRAPGVYSADVGPFFVRPKAPRYPGEGNRQQRRAAAKGQVRK